MRNRGRLAAKVAGVAGAAALVFGVVGPASAATQDVSYALSSGTVRVGSNTYTLPAATGIVGTWDDVSGDFTGTFSSDGVDDQQDVTSPLVGTIDLRYQFVATTPVTGNIDPATGTGTLATTFNVVVLLKQLNSASLPQPLVLDQTCTITGVPVSYAVTATGLGAQSEIFTDLSLTAAGFAAPAATCVAGPNGNPALTPTVETNFNTSAGLPTSDTESAVGFTAGAVPPPAPTTTTTTAAPTSTTTTASTVPTTPSTAAKPVVTQAKFTG